MEGSLEGTSSCFIYHRGIQEGTSAAPGRALVMKPDQTGRDRALSAVLKDQTGAVGATEAAP